MEMQGLNLFCNWYSAISNALLIDDRVFNEETRGEGTNHSFVWKFVAHHYTTDSRDDTSSNKGDDICKYDKVV